MNFQQRIDSAKQAAQTDEDKLFTQWMPLVIRECKKLGRADDDSFQIGSIGLLRAVREYKPELGHFAALAGTYIRNELANDWRYNTRKMRSGRKQEKLPDPPDSFSWEATEARMEDPWALVEGRYEPFVRAYYEGESLKDMAKRLGITRERARQKVRSGIEQARKRIA